MIFNVSSLGSEPPSTYPLGMFGFFNVNKPPGPTSHDVVAQVRRKLPRGVKVGHAGTLDPFADGVLVICVGGATRLAEYAQAHPKRYTAKAILGATSSTDDSEGEITQTPDATAPPEAAVRRALGAFAGQIDQVPPAHSAVHVDGRRAYQLARAGKSVRLAPRPVTIHSIELLDYSYPVLEIDVNCGSGTYIRSLARDIGEGLGVGGYCWKLTRTEVGPFRLEDAVTIDELDPQQHLLPPTFGLGRLPSLQVTSQQSSRLAQGQLVTFDSPQAKPAGSDIAVLDHQGLLVAIASLSDDGLTLKPAKVFVSRR